MVTEQGCQYLSSSLRSNFSHLRELDLSYNHPGDSGVKLLNHPDTLDKLKYVNTVVYAYVFLIELDLKTDTLCFTVWIMEES